MNYIAAAIFLIVCIICYSAQKKQQQLTGWKSIKVGLPEFGSCVKLK